MPIYETPKHSFSANCVQRVLKIQHTTRHRKYEGDTTDLSKSRAPRSVIADGVTRSARRHRVILLHRGRPSLRDRKTNWY
mmetsp:Transcript_9129/g.10430  ORF Transcript_9129/g.10430 Transcript_9129/m.10430 type:complete len:80 (+) Transcript_9129:630-869(+)